MARPATISLTGDRARRAVLSAFGRGMPMGGGGLMPALTAGAGEIAAFVLRLAAAPAPAVVLGATLLATGLAVSRRRLAA